jgi:hypothetical protein
MSLATLLLVACGHDATQPLPEPPAGTLAGVLQLYSWPQQISIPDHVTAGDSILVQIATFGRHVEEGVCLAGAGPTVVRPVSGGVEIRPYDRSGYGACLDDLVLYKHDVAIPTGTGDLTVRVVGRSVPGGAESVFERTVSVLPR